MKLTKEAKEKIKDKHIRHALEYALNRSFWTLQRWMKLEETPFYHHSEAVRDKFLEVMNMTFDEAFEQ